MPGPFITDEQVAHARELARDITEPIFQLIDKNTTVSVERTVLRWFGVDGVGAMGAPLVNLMVDRLRDAGVLELVHHQVHQRDPARPGAGDAQEAQHGALGGDGGVPPDEVEDRAGDLLGQRPGLGQLLVGDERARHGAVAYTAIPPC